MSDKEIIINIEGFVTNRINATQESLSSIGPTIPVKLIIGEFEKEIFAQIDTGANHSGINKTIADNLDALAIVNTGTINQQIAGEEAKIVPIFRGSLEFPNGTVINCDLAIIPNLPDDHGVLIGRDILSMCKIFIDFTTG